MSVNDMDPSFKSFGRAFQEKIVQALLSDHSWSQQMMEVLRPEYFEVNHLRHLFDVYSKHYTLYKTFPTITLLASMVRDTLNTGTDEILCGQIVDFLNNIRNNPNPNDLPYVKDRSLNFCRTQALKEALEVAVDLTKAERYEEIVEKIKGAITVGTPNTTGHDFFEDFAARFAKENRKVVSTGIKQLDAREIMNGGLGEGEIGIIMSPTGGGKCCHGDTCINIRHEQIIIDGKRFNPWDHIQTKRGKIYARDIVESDELV